MKELTPRKNRQIKSIEWLKRVQNDGGKPLVRKTKAAKRKVPERLTRQTRRSKKTYGTAGPTKAREKKGWEAIYI